MIDLTNRKFDVITNCLDHGRHLTKTLKLIKHLKNKKKNILLMTNSFYVTKKIHKLGFQDIVNTRDQNIKIINFHNWDFFRKKYNLDLSLERIAELEFEQNHISYINFEDCKNFCLWLFNIYEEIFRTNKIKSAFQIFSTDAERFIFLIMTQANCQKSFSITQGYIPNKEILVLNSYGFHSKSFLDKLEKNLNSNISYKNCDIYISDFYNKIYEQKKDNKYLSRRLSNLGFLKKNFYIEFFSRFKSMYIFRKWISFKLQKFFLIKIRKTIYKFFEMDLDKNLKNYIFFPFQAPAESTSVTYGFPYKDEINLVLNIADKIPNDYKLVVKQHPGYEGYLSLKGLNRLIKNKKIILIKSNYDSHKIMKMSNLIITKNSSVWFEGSLLKKPVITLGKGIFSGTKITEELDSIDNLSKTINKLFSAEYSLEQRTLRLFFYIKMIESISYFGSYAYKTDAEYDNYLKAIDENI